MFLQISRCVVTRAEVIFRRLQDLIRLPTGTASFHGDDLIEGHNVLQSKESLSSGESEYEQYWVHNRCWQSGELQSASSWLLAGPLHKDKHREED